MLQINDVNRIYLGAQGENQAQTIIINVSAWLSSYPNGTVTLWHKRNGDSAPSPTGATLDRENGTLTWTPTSTDTYVSGVGEAEVRLYENGIVKKSRKIITGVSPSVTGSGQPLGSGWQDYLDAIERAAGVAIVKNGMIRFSIDDNGHLIFGYTDQVPVEDEEEESNDD